MPILLKEDGFDSKNLDNMKTLPVFATSGFTVPLAQVVDSFAYDYHYNVIKRYNRDRVMMAQCDPKRGCEHESGFFGSVEQGEKYEYAGRLPDENIREDESQVESNEALAANMPLTFILMFIVLLLLFRTYRKPTIILLMVPLIFIRGGLRFAGDGENVRFFRFIGRVGVGGDEYQECDCTGGPNWYRTGERVGSAGCRVAGHEIKNRSGGNGFGYDDIGYAALVVRRNVWRHGCLHHGWLVGSQFVDYRGVARDVLFDIQDKSG